MGSPYKLMFTNSSLMRTQQRLLDIIKEKYDIQLVDDNPDYIIASAFDSLDVLTYQKAVRILFTGENITPDFNIYDYAIGFDHLCFGDRYLRIPLYCLYPDYDNLCSGRLSVQDYRSLAKRKFCSFVVSNGSGSDPIRTEFFEELCKYKKVDSAGRYMNNMGGGYLKNKRDFLAEYKFNIAFENSYVDGYTTEKIMDPMIVNSVPIYWGNRMVNIDFNPHSFINLSNYDTVQECIDRIIELDSDDNKYIELLHQSWFNEDGGYFNYKERIWDFFGNIFSKPVSQAKYISNYGYQPYYRQRFLSHCRHENPWTKGIGYYYRGKNFFHRFLSNIK